MFNTFIVLAGLLLGSLIDIRTREIPDTLNFSLIGIGLISGLFMSVFHSSISYIASSITGFLAGAIIGIFLFYTGQWGGGDAKMVMGIGALTGLSLHEFGAGIPFFLVFIINSLLIGAVYGLIWVFAISIKNFKEIRKEFTAMRQDKQVIFLRKIIIALLIIIIPLLFILQIDFIAKIMILVALFFFFISFHASMFLRATVKVGMVKDMEVSKLTEGDWVVEQVKLKKGKVFKPPKTGVSLDDIDLLKKNNVKKVAVKQGIPFVPSFLLAYIATLFIGNWFLFVL